MAVRIGRAALIFMTGLLIGGGAGVLLVVCARTWPAEGEGLLGVWALIFAMLAAALLIALMLACAPDADLRGGPLERTSAAFRLFLLLSLITIGVFGWTLLKAADEQALRARGVVESAVIVAKQERCVPADPGCYKDYSYTLRSLAGLPIQPNLDTGIPGLSVGGRITVLADPRGQIVPSLNTGLSPRRWLLATIAVGSAGVACLIVVAWTASAPRVRH